MSQTGLTILNPTENIPLPKLEWLKELYLGGLQTKLLK